MRNSQKPPEIVFEGFWAFDYTRGGGKKVFPSKRKTRGRRYLSENVHRMKIIPVSGM
jgi:hypothetical protein